MRQLELVPELPSRPAPEVSAGPGEPEGQERLAPPRVLALYFPDLPLQRLLRAREAAGGRTPVRRPLAVERGGEVVACDAEARAAQGAPRD